MSPDARSKALEARLTAKILARERRMMCKIRALNDELIRLIVNQRMSADDRRACFYVVGSPHGNEKTSSSNLNSKTHVEVSSPQAQANPAHPGYGERNTVRHLHGKHPDNVHAGKTTL